MKNSDKVAAAVLSAVGGKENVANVTHCMTRLRFDLKDKEAVDRNGLKSIDGVLGVAEMGGQLQVIIGQSVSKVYDEICALGNFDKRDAIEENLDADLVKKPLTLKTIGGNILNYLSKSITQLIPIMIAAGLFKAVSTVFGPAVLGVITEDNSLYILGNALFNAGFYYMPIYLGYAAAKTLGISPVLGMLMGGILVSPDLIALAGQPFDVYGIPTTMQSYAQTVLPVLLSVWVMSYVLKFFTKIIPETVSMMFVPFLTLLVMLPVSFVVLGPIGSFCGNIISQVIMNLDGPLGILGGVFLGAFWEFLVMTGMHLAIGVFSITTFIEQGSMTGAMVCGTYATAAVWGMCLGAAIRLKNKEEKALSLGYFLSGIAGGVTEPGLYGLGFKYKRAFIGMIVGGAIASLYSGIMGVTQFVMAGATNLMVVLSFTGGSTMNLVNGIIATVLAFVVAAVVTYLTGFSKADLEKGAEPL